MNKLKVSASFFFILSLILSCGGKDKSTPGGPSGVLFTIRDAVSFEDLMKCYSSDTRAVIKKFVSDRVLSRDQAQNVLAILDKDASWEVISEEKEGTRAEVAIRITRHRIENRTGAQMNLVFVYEDGSWVVDMEKDLQSIGDRHKKSDAGGYLRKQFREYQ